MVNSRVPWLTNAREINSYKINIGVVVRKLEDRRWKSYRIKRQDIKIVPRPHPL